MQTRHSRALRDVLMVTETPWCDRMRTEISGVMFVNERVSELVVKDYFQCTIFLICYPYTHFLCLMLVMLFISTKENNRSRKKKEKVKKNKSAHLTIELQRYNWFIACVIFSKRLYSNTRRSANSIAQQIPSRHQPSADSTTPSPHHSLQTLSQARKKRNKLHSAVVE
jgi:uncharacterized membrane protein